MSRKETRARSLVLSVIVLLMLGVSWEIEGRILSFCEAARELDRARISRSFISNFVCLMNAESKMDTKLVTGPKIASSYSFGIFQINSRRWCTRGRIGGECNARCEDYADDDIRDDIVCAKKIFNRAGFQEWPGWVNKCKGKPLPNLRHCYTS